MLKPKPTQPARKRFQTRIPGSKRIPIPACVLDDIYAAIDNTAERYNVSRSFVMAVALGHFFGLDTEQYAQPRQPMPRHRNRKRSRA